MTASPEQVARELKREVAASWEARALLAAGRMSNPLPNPVLLLILAAALGPGAIGPGIRLTSFGNNAIIKKDRWLYSKVQFGQQTPLGDRYVDAGEHRICAVDDLNRALQWLSRTIDATDAEHLAIINKINGWIARDETQIGLHVERQRESLDTAKDIDLSDVEQELRDKGKL